MNGPPRQLGLNTAGGDPGGLKLPGAIRRPVDLGSVLQSVATDPWSYLPLLFAYTVASTLILPIPEEIGLLNPFIPWYYLVLVLGAGKTVGAALVYPLGGRVGVALERWIARWPWAASWYAWVQRQVGRYGYPALFALLAVPFMTDTAPVYAFSIANPAEGPGRMRFGGFLTANFLAGITRGFLFLAVPLYFGWS